MTCNSVLSGEAMPLFASGRNLSNRSWRTGRLHLYLDSSQPLGHEVIQKRADRTEDETQDTIEDWREKSKIRPPIAPRRLSWPPPLNRSNWQAGKTATRSNRS